MSAILRRAKVAGAVLVFRCTACGDECEVELDADDFNAYVQVQCEWCEVELNVLAEVEVYGPEPKSAVAQ